LSFPSLRLRRTTKEPHPTENVALDRIKSKALLQQIEEISMLPEKDQEVVVSFLDAFIKRRKFEELLRS
jgi:hypothetical protein